MPAAPDSTDSGEPDLYAALGVSSVASSTEIRRAYRTLITKQHPDKGGDANVFASIQRAYDVLSDSSKRSDYDARGVVERSVEEDLLDAFGGGAFKHRGVEAVLEKQTLAEALVKTKNAEATHSHSAGFEAWMRTRGDANRTIGVDDIVDAYGVVKGSYDEVRLPKIAAFETRRVVGEESVRPDGEGQKSNGVSLAFALSTTPIPNTLEWGQVLVHVRASPVNPADLAPGRGAEAGSNLVAETRKSERETNKDALSFLSIDGHGQTSAMEDGCVAGGDFIGEVLKVGAGVKALAEGDWVLPRHPGVGAWRSLFCAKEKALRKIPKDLMPLEHAAMLREYCVAYRLLEDAGDVLKPGDAVIVDGASGAIGGAVVRLCALLRLRAVALVRPSETSDTNRAYETFLASISSSASAVRDDDRDDAPTPFSQNTSSNTTASSCSASFLKTAARLKHLGAAEVLVDEGDARAALERRRFFARPKLGMDCVGGASAARLAHCLQDSGVLVVFGCMSGYAVTLPWTTLVARGLSCRGFSLRKWMDKAGEIKIAKMFETVAKLVVAGELSIDHCEYELSTELHEAVEHAAERRKEVKVVLRVEEVGDTYE